MNTVQDIFNKFFSTFKENNKPFYNQLKAANNIMDCRTKQLGGTVYKCNNCGHKDIRYKSCKNRNCPQCQGIKRVVWADKRSKDVINAPYFHVVFTIPEEFRMFVYQNQVKLYNLMFKAVSETLLELCGDEKYLGAQPGFTCVLHTWTQDLLYHPHIHVILLAGGLTKLKTWRASKKKFFMPVRVLSSKFRGKFLHYLKQYYYQNEIELHGSLEKFKNPQLFEDLLSTCYSKKWYSYTKKTFSGPLAVINYLAGYTHRIAISNTRIISVDNKTVKFSIKDRKNGNKLKIVSLDGLEFVRRFLMHVLPTGFIKIRYYGITSNKNKNLKLKLCRKLTLSPTYKSKFDGLDTIEIVNMVLGKNIMTCPVCNKVELQQVLTFYAGEPP